MNVSINTPAVKLKASFYTLTTLQIHSVDLRHIVDALNQLIKQTPQFFRNLSVILDIQSLPFEKTSSLDLGELVTCLRQLGLIPIGLRGGTAAQQACAQQAGLGLFANSHEAKAPSEMIPTKMEASGTKLLSGPIRSGQQIYSSGDLIIVGSVSAGAELLAEGHIHVYGRLSGRALAGISENIAAYIFCSSLESELVSIAGNYWLHDDLPSQNRLAPAYFFLKEGQLQLRDLSS